MGETNIDTGFSAGDFRLLEKMAFAGSSVAPHSEARIEALWAKAARLVDQLGKKLFPTSVLRWRSGPIAPRMSDCLSSGRA